MDIAKLQVVSSFPRDVQPNVDEILPQVLRFATGKQVRMLVYSLVVFYYPLAVAAMTVSGYST